MAPSRPIRSPPPPSPTPSTPPRHGVRPRAHQGARGRPQARPPGGGIHLRALLTDGAGNVLEGYPIEAKNDKDGKVSFGELSFTIWALPRDRDRDSKRRCPDEDDAHAYTFDIAVTQTGAGLKAEIFNERGKKTFTNTFTPHDNTKTVTKADASGAKVNVDGSWWAWAIPSPIPSAGPNTASTTGAPRRRLT